MADIASSGPRLDRNPPDAQCAQTLWRPRRGRQPDLEVQPGQCFGLLGPNGAGKTTTLRMLLGLTTPASGTLMLCGEPIPQRAPQARMRVGVVPQFDNLDPDFSVIENLRIFGRYFGLSSAQIAERVPKLLEFARLESRADAQVRDLSGGMRRRLTVARALINDPDLLIMDEPTTGLDPQARHLIWERLKSLLGRQDDSADHPLHGGSRTALQPPVRHRRGSQDR
jgi:lipooligosaccharide transport system ATP-binding protein